MIMHRIHFILKATSQHLLSPPTPVSAWDRSLRSFSLIQWVWVSDQEPQQEKLGEGTRLQSQSRKVAFRKPGDVLEAEMSGTALSAWLHPGFVITLTSAPARLLMPPPVRQPKWGKKPCFWVNLGAKTAPN